MYVKLLISLAVIFLAKVDHVSAMTDVAEIMMKHSQEFMKNGSECKTKVGATDEDVAIFLSKKLPDTKTGDCMIACMMEKMGTMVDGKFVTDAPQVIAHSILGQGDMIAELVGDVSKACAKALTSADDHCTVAKKVAVCSLDHIKKFKDVVKKD